MQASPDGFTIEPARREDVPVLLALIRELAQFERLEHECVATPTGLESALFGPRPCAEALVARAAGEPVGFALFLQNFSTFVGRPGLYLEDLYIRPTFRGRGYGEALLRHLARLAVERGYGRFEWAVLDWNQRAIDFYRKLGARALDDWTIFRVTGEALERLARPQGGFRSPVAD